MAAENSALFNKARVAFDDMVQEQIAADIATTDHRAARAVGILEAASVIEDMLDRAKDAPNPSPELVNLIALMLEQVMALVEFPRDRAK